MFFDHSQPLINIRDEVQREQKLFFDDGGKTKVDPRTGANLMVPDPNGKVLTHSYAIQEALLGEYTDEQIQGKTVDFKERTRRFELYLKFKEVTPVKLEDDDVILIKTLLAKRWATLVCGQVCHALSEVGKPLDADAKPAKDKRKPSNVAANGTHPDRIEVGGAA